MVLTGISRVYIPVRDQTEAKEWYVEKLGLECRTDEEVPGEDPSVRWIELVIPNDGSIAIVLEPVEFRKQEREETLPDRVGNNSGLIFQSDDLRTDCRVLKERGVHVKYEPKQFPWGLQIEFFDLYGHNFTIVEPPKGTETA